MIRGGLAVLPVASVASAVRFYVETLGLKLVAYHEPEAADGADSAESARATLDLGDGFLVALVAAPSARARPVTLGLRVASVERAASLLENRGLALRSEVHAGVAACTFSDPDGNTLFLLELDATGR